MSSGESNECKKAELSDNLTKEKPGNDDLYDPEDDVINTDLERVSENEKEVTDSKKISKQLKDTVSSSKKVSKVVFLADEFDDAFTPDEDAYLALDDVDTPSRHGTDTECSETETKTSSNISNSGDKSKQVKDTKSSDRSDRNKSKKEKDAKSCHKEKEAKEPSQSQKKDSDNLSKSVIRSEKVDKRKKDEKQTEKSDKDKESKSSKNQKTDKKDDKDQEKDKKSTSKSSLKSKPQVDERKESKSKDNTKKSMEKDRVDSSKKDKGKVREDSKSKKSKSSEKDSGKLDILSPVSPNPTEEGKMEARNRSNENNVTSTDNPKYKQDIYDTFSPDSPGSDERNSKYQNMLNVSSDPLSPDSSPPDFVFNKENLEETKSLKNMSKTHKYMSSTPLSPRVETPNSAPLLPKVDPVKNTPVKIPLEIPLEIPLYSLDGKGDEDDDDDEDEGMLSRKPLRVPLVIPLEIPVCDTLPDRVVVTVKGVEGTVKGERFYVLEILGVNMAEESLSSSCWMLPIVRQFKSPSFKLICYGPIYQN